MKSILTILFSFLFIVSGFSQTRNVVVDTNGVVVQPTNIWTANATNARSGLGLGSAATNPSSAFQPSSAVLSNLASSNGVNLTNIPVAGVVGALTTNGNGFGLTNLNATNISGIVSLVNGGTGATNASDARINLGLSSTNDVYFNRVQVGGTSVTTNGFSGNVFITGSQSISFTSGGNPATTRTNLGLGATNDVTFKTIIADPLANGGYGFRFGTNLTGLYVGASYNDIYFAVGGSNVFRGLATNINFEVPVSFSSPAQTRTNLGLGWSALTNTNSGTTILSYDSNNAIVVSSTNTNALTFNYPIALSGTSSITGMHGGPTITMQSIIQGTGFRTVFSGSTNLISNGTYDGTNYFLTINAIGTNVAIFRPSAIEFLVPLQFNNITNIASTRTNLGLGSSWLTNTNNPVFVNTNGEVVSPTNFWDVAPIQTLVQNFTPVANATNAATNARTLYVYSLAISTIGVTNVVTLPTNTATKNGDEVTVIHMGPTSSITAIRQLGQTNNLITINKTDESVKFIYENNAWTNFHNISFVEPIFFSGTNASVNAAASRTNLGLVLPALTNTNNATFQEAIFTTNAPPTNSANVNTVNFNTAISWMAVSVVTNGVTNEFHIPLFR